MTRLFTTILFLSFTACSFAQSDSEQKFYTSLQKAIRTAALKGDSVEVTETSKVCFGSSWKAVIQPKRDSSTVTFYADRVSGTLSDSTIPQISTMEDTSFSLPTATLLRNLEREKQYLQTNMVISYNSIHYLVQQGKTARQYTLEKGQGLYYLLRFNKSWSSYVTGN